jgi:hypothetical protein
MHATPSSLRGTNEQTEQTALQPSSRRYRRPLGPLVGQYLPRRWPRLWDFPAGRSGGASPHRRAEGIPVHVMDGLDEHLPRTRRGKHNMHAAQGLHTAALTGTQQHSDNQGSHSQISELCRPLHMFHIELAVQSKGDLQLASGLRTVPRTRLSRPRTYIHGQRGSSAPPRATMCPYWITRGLSAASMIPKSFHSHQTQRRKTDGDASGHDDADRGPDDPPGAH